VALPKPLLSSPDRHPVLLLHVCLRRAVHRVGLLDRPLCPRHTKTLQWQVWAHGIDGYQPSLARGLIANASCASARLGRCGMPCAAAPVPLTHLVHLQRWSHYCDRFPLHSWHSHLLGRLNGGWHEARQRRPHIVPPCAHAAALGNRGALRCCLGIGKSTMNGMYVFQGTTPQCSAHCGPGLCAAARCVAALRRPPPRAASHLLSQASVAAPQRILPGK
jgi:hypothetical protein